jgi:hypothetical protein
MVLFITKRGTMKNKGSRLNDNLIYVAIVIIVILIFVFGKRGGEETNVLEEDLDLETPLVPTISEEEPQSGIIEGDIGVVGVVEEETLPAPEPENLINIGKKFLLYYDFSKREFTDKRSLEQDIFSQRFSKHLAFTRFDPVTMRIIDKDIDSVEKDDCIGIKDSFEYLYSGQSLCVITKEKNIVALGGTWDDTGNAELTWKLFS